MVSELGFDGLSILIPSPASLAGARPARILADLHHENLLRLLVAGQFFFPGARGKRLAGSIGLTPHLSQKEAGAVSLEDKLAARWGVGGFPLVGEEYQWTLPFLAQDDAAAFRVHLHRVVASGQRLVACYEPKRYANRHLMVKDRTGVEGCRHCEQ